MHSTGNVSAPAPPEQRSRPGSEILLLRFTGDSSLWNSGTITPHIPRRNELPLLSGLKQWNRHRRFHLHPVFFVALAAFATTYLLLRCVRHLGDINKPKGVLRSLSAVEKDDEGWGAACAFESQEDPARAAVGDELDEKQVLDRAERYTSNLAKMMVENKERLLSMPQSISAKAFTNLLRFCTAELAALCSLLETKQRQPVKETVEILVPIVNFFKAHAKRNTPCLTTKRHITCMRGFLEELRGMDYAGSALAPRERLLKLDQLLTLQELALTKVQYGMQFLADRCQEEGEPLSEEAEQEYMRPLYKISDSRKDHVLRDEILGRWLVKKLSKVRRFGLVPPQKLTEILNGPQLPFEELRKQLEDIPFGLTQQQISQRASEQTASAAGRQGVEASLSTDVRAGQADMTSSSPKGSSSPEASVEHGRPAGVERSAALASRDSGASGGPEPSERLDLAGAGGASWSVPAASYQVPEIHVSPLTSGSYGDSETFSAAEASASLGMLPPPDSGAARPMTFSGQSAKPDSAEVSARFWTPELTTTAERFGPSPASPPQVFIPSSAGSADFTERVRAFDANVHSQTPRTPQRQLTRRPEFWTGGREERAELGQDDEVSRSDPEHRGFWGPHTLVSPSQPAYPLELWGTYRQLERGTHQYGQGLLGFPGLSTVWHLPGAPPAERPHLEPGMTGHPLAAAGSSTWHGRQSGFSRRGRSGAEMPRTPPIGMPVGEPERGIGEQHGASAAGVAAALFSPDSADPSKSLRLLKKSSDEAD